MRTIEISEETYDEKINLSSLSDLVGHKFLFRTVTFFLVGKVENVSANIITLSTASWIASTGRFSNCIKEGTFDEVEPVGTAYLNFASVVDFFPWNYPLPTKQR